MYTISSQFLIIWQINPTKMYGSISCIESFADFLMDFAASFYFHFDCLVRSVHLLLCGEINVHLLLIFLISESNIIGTTKHHRGHT